LIPLADDALLSAARQRGTFPVMHLSTLTESGQFDTYRGELVLTDPAIQEQLIRQILQTVLQRGYAGVDVDFEYLPGTLAISYAAFLSRLRRLLHAQGRFLWVALAPKTSAAQKGLLYEGHDYPAIGAASDGVLLMTYEWGYTYGPPMAVAPLPNVRAVLDYAVTAIPSSKIFLGIPNYGYDWPLPFVQGVTRAQSISNQRAIELAIEHQVAIQFDPTSQSPFFHYTDPAGTVHEVWFEDARSMEAKLKLISEYGFQGAGFWNLMRPFSQTWLVLDSLYTLN
jgi:spore germination protein